MTGELFLEPNLYKSIIQSIIFYWKDRTSICIAKIINKKFARSYVLPFLILEFKWEELSQDDQDTVPEHYGTAQYNSTVE